MEFDTAVEYNQDKNLIILIPKGDMDIYSSSEFKEDALKAYDDKKTDMLIDCDKLDYIDSTGLGALMTLLKKVKENNHKIYLSNVKPNIKKLLDITELDKLFVIRGEDNE